MKKIIFLDIDGVLNSSKFVSENGLENFIDETKVQLLREIVDATGAEIVLTSTRREYWNREPSLCDEQGEYINRMLGKCGLTIFDKTTDISYSARVTEVMMWVKENDVDAYVVFDDEEIYRFPEEHFVKTKLEEGLQPRHVRRAEAILNGTYEKRCIIDTHAHLTHRKFNSRFRYAIGDGNGFALGMGTREGMISKMADENIRYYIEPAISLESNQRVIDFCKEHSFCFPAVGVHPVGFCDFENRFKLEEILADNLDSVVAVGETGIDFEYTRNPWYNQLKWFDYQISLADKYNKPLILHVRKAHSAVLTMLKLRKKKLHGGVVHCFTGNAKTAEEYIKLGFYIGIGSALIGAYPLAEELEDTVKNIPLSSILIETDSPFLCPRGVIHWQRRPRRAGTCITYARDIKNSPLILPNVIARIAEIKGMDYDDVELAVMKNAVKAFNLDIEL